MSKPSIEVSLSDEAMVFLERLEAAVEKLNAIEGLASDNAALLQRAERAEATLREVVAIMDGFENEKPGKAYYDMLIYRIRDRIALHWEMKGR